MPAPQIVEYLERHGIRYDVLPHEIAYTAQEAAAAAHVPGSELAKPVVVKLDGKLVLAVLPASHQVELEALAREAGAETAELASEEEFADRFPGSEVGAMPPLGRLYDLPVFADGSLEADETIAFSAGTHSELIRMSYADYKRLERPRIARFGQKAN